MKVETETSKDTIDRIEKNSIYQEHMPYIFNYISDIYNIIDAHIIDIKNIVVRMLKMTIIGSNVGFNTTPLAFRTSALTVMWPGLPDDMTLSTSPNVYVA